MSALSTSPTRGETSATTSTARLTTAITSSQSPSTVVNIELSSQDSPDSWTTRTAAATASDTEPSSLLAVGEMLKATSMMPTLPPRCQAQCMILACHTLIYSDDADATRTFFKDVLGFPSIDAGTEDHSWLIFGTGPSELGVHPTAGEGYSSPRHHAISFIVDDLESTMAELRSKGAEFSSGPDDHGYGIVAMVQVPGADDVQLYQPRHPTAYQP